MLYDARIPGNETCAPSGLTLLKSWADAAALGDVVVVALGTNDSGLFEKPALAEQLGRGPAPRRRTAGRVPHHAGARRQ